MNDVLLTLEEFSAQLRISNKTARRWIAAKKVNAIRLPGGQWRIRKQDLDTIIKSS